MTNEEQEKEMIDDENATTDETSDETWDDTSETDEHVYIPLDSSHSSPQSDFYAQPGLSNQPGWGYGQSR